MARAAKKATPTRPRKAAPANRGHGEPGVAKYDPAKHPRGPDGKFLSKGGPAAKAKTTRTPKAPKPPRKVGTPKQRKGLADQIRKARAEARTPEQRAALLKQVRDLRAKRAEWKRGQGKKQVESLPRPSKPKKEPKPKAPKEPRPKAEPKPKKAPPKEPKSKGAGSATGPPATPSFEERVEVRVREEAARLKKDVSAANKSGDLDRKVAVADEVERWRNWERDVKTNHNLLPPLPIAERMALYAERTGNAKIDKILALEKTSPEIESKLAELEVDASAARAQLYRQAFGTKEFDAAKAKMEAVDSRRNALLAERGVGVQPVEKLARVLAPGKTLEARAILDDPKAVGASYDPLNPQLKSAVGEGMAFLKGLVSDAGLGPLGVPFARLSKKAKAKAKTGERSNCKPAGIVLEDGVGAATVVHEFGHYLEFHTGAGRSAQDFLKHRVGDEKPVKMKDVVPESRYRDDEVGRKDKFEDALGEHGAYYAGKDYGKRATEITSMGIEALYKDPVKFAKKDREYAMFVLGVMDGSLR